MAKPLITYIKAIFQPKLPKSRTKATSFIIGEATKKENVTPSGTPASINPKNKGTALQEQKGVIIPNREAKILPISLFLRDKIFFIFSFGKNERTMETKKLLLSTRQKFL